MQMLFGWLFTILTAIYLYKIIYFMFSKNSIYTFSERFKKEYYTIYDLQQYMSIRPSNIFKAAIYSYIIVDYIILLYSIYIGYSLLIVSLWKQILVISIVIGIIILCCISIYGYNILISALENNCITDLNDLATRLNKIYVDDFNFVVDCLILVLCINVLLAL